MRGGVEVDNDLSRVCGDDPTVCVSFVVDK